MKNLENEKILSDEILNAVLVIIKQDPNVIFGGSIALNAINLLSRPISDIDLCFRKGDNLSRMLFDATNDASDVASVTATDVNGEKIQRISTKILGIKTCCFKLSDEQLQHSKHTFNRNGTEITICIQNVNYAIEAKRAYSDICQKHKVDLESISEVLNNTF
jgi:hypothetical protein